MIILTIIGGIVIFFGLTWVILYLIAVWLGLDGISPEDRSKR